LVSCLLTLQIKMDFISLFIRIYNYVNMQKSYASFEDIAFLSLLAL